MIYVQTYHKIIFMVQCQFCNKSFNRQAGLSIHLLSCSLNPNKSISFIKALHSPKGLGYKWSDERRAKHRITMQKAVKDHPESYKGHYQKHAINYNGEIYDSNWEIIVKKYFDKCNITNTRIIKTRFTYQYHKSEHVYIPDFYLKNLKTYVEVKRMITPRDIEKWRQFPKNKRLVVLTAKSIYTIQRNKSILLAKHLRENPKENLLIDGIPIADSKSLTITKVREASKKQKLSKEERSLILKEAIAKSPFFRERKRKALLNKKEREEKLDKRYSGKHNSQYGTYWITNGVINKKWKDSKGELPSGFYKGRIC